MNAEQKQLYLKIKKKHYSNFNRIVKRIFKDHFDKLNKRTTRDAEIIGSHLTVFEMELKQALKKSI
jgi:hypothetical protein